MVNRDYCRVKLCRELRGVDLGLRESDQMWSGR